jgi:ketosteroid isomerase-like protein
MADTKTVIAQAYSAFNKRDIDGALELMTQDVNWPKASEGGKVVGKEEMRRIELQQLLDKPTKKNRTRFIQRVVLRSALVFPRRHLIDDIATGERL